LLQAPEPVPDLAIGTEVRARGVLGRPPPWYRETLRRQGVTMVLRVPRVEPTGGRRGGLMGRLDAIRDRAATSLGRAMPPREAALARGFVLGQDDRIDPGTIEDFRRSGLAHLLAVSGQNVLLLVLLASPALAALGIPLRARLLWLLALIGAYVPLAGAGASIQRAGVMGAAAVVALLAGRPASRAFALLAAVAVTLAINPRTLADAGWQLSFAAVAGIYALAGPLRTGIVARIGGGRWQRALADGAATTVAASLATTPLVAHHFGSVPVGSLAANLVALPAIAPAMWLGMVSAALGQIPAAPVEPLNWLNSLLLAYIAQVAAWFAAPDWALLALPLEGPAAVVGAYALLASGLASGLRLWAGWRLDRERRKRDRLRVHRPAWVLFLLSLVALVLAAGASGVPERRGAGRGDSPPGLRVDFLDVGQGDSILLQPADGGALLIDGGPPGHELARKLLEAGAESLAVALVTHDQSDHAGGLEEILGDLPVGRLAFASPPRSLLADAKAAGARPLRIAEGDRITSGGLSLDVLWPPEAGWKTAVGGDPNARSVVLLARWRDFTMLLCGDAEAEAAPIDSGPVEVLKVAHHGSEDAGLAALLDRLAPHLAVISAGEGNPFGHPAPQTLRTLQASGIEVLRTDRDGRVTLEVGGTGVEVRTDR
jgi:competence protein ComEC